MNKLILIDGNSLINRAFYATPLLTDKNGQPTNAVYAFMNMLVKLISEESPKYILVAFDRREPTFRHKMFDAYKGTRKPMPEELRPQIPLLKKVLKSVGIYCYEEPGLEADDIIGALSKKYDGETIIITGDKDSFQLVDESTSVHFTRRGISDIDVYNSENFREKTGILPYQIVDLKALMGDSSDNIPGVQGVGEKTALNLVQTYVTVENLYQNVSELKGKLQEKIIASRDMAFLSKTLATINVDAKIPVEIENLTYTFPFDKTARKTFSELDFKGLLKRTELFTEDSLVSDDEEKSISKKEEISIKNLTSISEIEEVLSNDSITLVLYNGVNIYVEKDGIEYKIKQKEAFFDEGFSDIDVLNFIKPYIENENKKVIVYSYKKLAEYLSDFDISFNAKYDDVDILRYLIDFSGKEESFEQTLEHYSLNIQTPAYSLYTLYKRFISDVESQNVSKLYYDVELPLAKILFDMQVTGFKIDVKALDGMGEKFKAELNELSTKINELAGEQINPNSPKQLGIIIYEKLGLSKGKKTKTGSYSTTAEELEAIADTHPIIPLILRYRTIQKLNSTYIDGLRSLIDKKTGLVHTCFNQTLTQTGRLSSKEPNLQNIPVREDEGRELRKLFIARDEDSVLIDADYSQIELRLLAHFSGSEELIKAYNEGRDIHSVTASQVFDVELNKVTSTMRRNAKAVNFGIIYGISDFGLAKNIKISPKQAKQYIAKYFETYPSVKEYMDSNVDFARKNGYVSTLLNRKRYIKEINSHIFAKKTFSERAAMNMPLQGTSADIIKIAMVNVYNRLKKENLRAKLILQVHDELIIDAPISEREIAKKILVEEMENAVSLKVPLTVEANEGKTWYETK